MRSVLRTFVHKQIEKANPRRELTAEEVWDVAYKQRVVSVAVSRKKKVAVDAISNVVKGVFP